MRMNLTDGAVSIGSFFFWAATSSFVRTSIRKPESLANQPETGRLVLNYYCNYNSLLHCFYLLSGAIFCLIKYPFIQNRKFRNLELLLVRISMAYYLFDTVNGIFFDYNDFWMNVHHVLVFTAYFHSLYYQTHASEIMITIVIGEISNPFLILMKTTQFEGNKQLSMIMGAMFVISYIILRGYFALKMAKRVSLSNADNLLKVCCSLTCKIVSSSSIRLLLLAVRNLCSDYQEARASFATCYSGFTVRNKHFCESSNTSLDRGLHS
jgi:TLC domain